mmetsp:Transcript_8721/g.13226  ORF Transcript_8721/g.13226 Transcript_8721/m.13226 type:complete len:156 (-) Transcript_8721:53-520(-)
MTKIEKENELIVVPYLCSVLSHCPNVSVSICVLFSLAFNLPPVLIFIPDLDSAPPTSIPASILPSALSALPSPTTLNTLPCSLALYFNHPVLWLCLCPKIWLPSCLSLPMPSLSPSPSCFPFSPNSPPWKQTKNRKWSVTERYCGERKQWCGREK